MPTTDRTLEGSPIAGIYETYLGRPGDPGGLEFYRKKYLTGESELEQIGREVYQSPEAREKRYAEGQATAQAGGSPSVTYSPTSTSADFLRNVYINEVGREPDPEGLSYWAKQMESGMSREDVIAGFNRSQEGVGYDVGAAPTVPAVSGQDGRLSDILGAVSGYEAAPIPSAPETDTVEGRVQGIIDRGGPALQSEVTRAMQAANQLGLLNTSMAAGAMERARYDYALPIATQDAAQSLQTKLANQAATGEAAKFTAAEKNIMLQQEMVGIQQLGLAGAQAGYQEARDIRAAEGVATRDVLLAEQQQERDLLLNVHATNLQNMSNENAQLLERIRGDNADRLQTSMSASNIFSQTSLSISNILSNPDIKIDQKEQLVAQEISLLQNALAVLDGITLLDLSGLLDFSTTDSSAPDITTPDTGRPTGRTTGRLSVGG